MKAVLLERRRVILSPTAFAEIVVWRLPSPVSGCRHLFKYRLALVEHGACVLRYDNESGKGDHVHVGKVEQQYEFQSPSRLLADFSEAIERWRHEHRET
ncbi:MAG: hypothetical protein HZB71_03535 [Betaproteobacteria bacterium]|nr:hypothetical protein [Betaproteobacteria bacterium]